MAKRGMSCQIGERGWHEWYLVGEDAICNFCGATGFFVGRKVVIELTPLQDSILECIDMGIGDTTDIANHLGIKYQAVYYQIQKLYTEKLIERLIVSDAERRYRWVPMSPENN